MAPGRSVSRSSESESETAAAASALITLLGAEIEPLLQAQATAVVTQLRSAADKASHDEAAPALAAAARVLRNAAIGAPMRYARGEEMGQRTGIETVSERRGTEEENRDRDRRGWRTETGERRGKQEGNRASGAVHDLGQ